MARNVAIILGPLIALAVLAVLCVNSHRAGIEADLAERSGAVLAGAGLEGVSVSTRRCHDIRLQIRPPQPAREARVLAAGEAQIAIAGRVADEADLSTGGEGLRAIEAFDPATRPRNRPLIANPPGCAARAAHRSAHARTGSARCARTPSGTAVSFARWPRTASSTSGWLPRTVRTSA